MTDNPNPLDNSGDTPITCAVLNGHTEIVKILAPLTDNPNASCEGRLSPVEIAKLKGHSEIVRILESFEKSAKRRRITHDGK